MINNNINNNNNNKTNQMTTNNFHAYQKIKINMTTTFMFHETC